MRTLVHEMRNQLAVATANIEAFLDGKLTPSEKRLSAVLHALLAIDALIDDIPSTLSSPVHMEIEPKPMNICQLIDTTIEGMQAAMDEKNLSLTYNGCRYVKHECAVFVGDAIRIGQILRNLFLNAIAYTPPGGKIDIDCHREFDGLEIVIEDSGHGLSDEDLAHLFEPGYRGSASVGVEGTGLGLAIVQRLLHSQGGAIIAERRPTGTAFRVRLNDRETPCGSCEGGGNEACLTS